MTRAILTMTAALIVMTPVATLHAEQFEGTIQEGVVSLGSQLERAQQRFNHLQNRLLTDPVSGLTARIDQALQNESDAEQIFDEQIKIVKILMEEISPNSSFSMQLKNIQDRATESFDNTNNHFNLGMQRATHTFQEQINRVEQIRTDAQKLRNESFKAIRDLEDNREVAVMLIRANALDVAVALTQEKLEEVRTYNDRIIELVDEVRKLNEDIAD